MVDYRYRMYLHSTNTSNHPRHTNVYLHPPSKMAMNPVETAGFEGFTPRSQHSMAYDSAKDMVYITGGTSSRNRWMWDLLTFSFGM